MYLRYPPDSQPAVQWFCNNEPATGRPRKKPYKLDLAGPAAVDLAVQILIWLGQNMPGYTYPRKPKDLVCSCASAWEHDC